MALPSPAEAAEAIGLPLEAWSGQCYGVAVALVESGLVDGCAVYGHWLGPVAEGSHFDTGFRPFQRHGWIVLEDGSVVDPTRWAFEGVDPYIYHGPADHYDEGGNAFRSALRGPPPPLDLFEDEVITVGQHQLPTSAWNWLEKRLGLESNYADEGYEPGMVSKAQLIWLAHLDPREMGGHAPAVIEMLDDLGMGALVPIDNRRMAERMAGKCKLGNG
jgi:hypothetical protein